MVRQGRAGGDGQGARGNRTILNSRASHAPCITLAALYRARAAGNTAGMALPPSFFSARSQRGLLATSGAGARLLIPNRADFVSRLVVCYQPIEL